MAIATTSVYSTLTNPSGAPIAHAVVVGSLVGPTLIQGAAVEREIKTYTNEIGYWSLDLIPNPSFSSNPTDSWYLIRIGNKEEYRVYVPVAVNGVSSHEVSTLGPNGMLQNPQSIFTGNILFEGSILIQGDLYVSGIITAGLVQAISPVSFPQGANTTFFNDLQIVGNLKVTGALRYTGILTNPAYA